MDADSERAVNADGWFGMRMVRPGKTVVRCKQRSYAFAIRNGVAFSWVHPDDVPCCLAATTSCCGGRRRAIIRHATVREARIWQYGGRGD